jgi:elongation factor Ts
MMECKKVLSEADGDMEKATELLRERGMAAANKKAGRTASEGMVFAVVDQERQVGAVVEVNSETDFVAKNADFVALTKKILDLALETRPADLAALKASALDGSTVEQLVTDRSGITGEKMELDFYEFVNGPSTVAYIHPGNKLATIVAFNQAGVDAQVAKDIAMQVAAMNPVSVSKDNVPADIIAKEKEIAKDKARQAGKPENILDKIAEGAMVKYYKDNTLLEQDFIKDGKINVAQYMNTASKGLTATAFKRVTLNQE